MDTKEVIARFESERQALALMNHPNIARVFDAGATPEGRPYFAMEYVQGIPITEYCDKHRLTIRERLALFVDVCEGVQHAHQKGIIHRDIKPSNVLVTSQDEMRAPKIIDFGVAKATSQRLTEHPLFTELGQLIGTPEYMSPEQAEMTNLDIDTRTDVYSLGAVLYELLAGRQPFDSKELRQAGFAEIQRKLREEDPPKPSSRVSGLGPASTVCASNRRIDVRALGRALEGDLDWITMKALEKDRVRRYETAHATGARRAATSPRRARDWPARRAASIARVSCSAATAGRSSQPALSPWRWWSASSGPHRRCCGRCVPSAVPPPRQWRPAARRRSPRRSTRSSTTISWSRRRHRPRAGRART